MDKPWIEKYRPTNFDDIVLSEINKKMILSMLTNDRYPNMLFYGPPGTGKTTTILCLIKEYQKKHKCTQNYIHLNASHERGIEVIRNQIDQFTKTTTFFYHNHKFVLLDEMDSLTKQAQILLHRLIKKSSKSEVTFILICNYLNKVLPCIKESMFTLYFNQTSTICDDFIHKCLTLEKKNIQQKYIDNIKNQYTHDLRSILNCLQNYHSKDILLTNETFEDIMQGKKYIKVYQNIVSIYDTHTFLCSFFVYLYENYELNNDIILTMKSLLMNDNCDEYFFNVFLPFLRNKYKKN